MSETHGPYHRLGVPGGPGCKVGVLPVTGKGKDGTPFEADLLDAGPTATEVELLRTVAAGVGLRWGHDEHGWWAMVPKQK